MKIAIAGYGAEGQSSYRYYVGKGDDVTIVTDKVSLDYPIPEDARTIIAGDAFDQLEDFDIVIRTPPMSPQSIKTRGKVWSQTNEFFAMCPAPIIGVTGSKGKGTITSLIAAILQAAGHTVHLVGNIGIPALDALPAITSQDIVVYELSSFQLWDAEKSPHIAVIGVIEPEHLDVHANFDDYIAAKRNIAKHQVENDTVVFNATNTVSGQLADSSPGIKIPYPDHRYIHSDEEMFWYNEQKLCSVDALRLPGVHNLENACAAIAAAWNWVQDGATIAKGFSSFEGLPHRLKLVDEVRGVKYYDDSIATTPGSAIAALASFWQQKVIILGGSSKGANFAELAKKANTSRLKKALLIGAEANTIAAAFDKEQIPYENLGSNASMEQIVGRAAQIAEPQDIVILSPACASFGMFKNYADRGDQFIASVKALQ